MVMDQDLSTGSGAMDAWETYPDTGTTMEQSWPEYDILEELFGHNGRTGTFDDSRLHELDADMESLGFNNNDPTETYQAPETETAVPPPRQEATKRHFIKGFMQDTGLQNGESTWYNKFATSEGSEKTVIGDYIDCNCPDANKNCTGSCLVRANGTCRVPNCPFDRKLEVTRAEQRKIAAIQKGQKPPSTSGCTNSRHGLMHLRMFLCPYKGCQYETLGFPLETDLKRHLKTVKQHIGMARLPDRSKEEYFCPEKTCARHTTKPFNRWDNLTAHRRNIHGENIGKRKGRVAKTARKQTAISG